MPDARLPEPFGLLINRQQTVDFHFDKKSFSGVVGDSIASALAANNQWLLSRSFKYHRPRGVLTMAGQDANTLVQLPSDPNSLADKYALTEGMQVSAQNYSGSLENDRGALLELFSRFMPVGFYYKAFFRPRGIWEKWAPLIRAKAGLGVVDQTYVADAFDKQYLFFDIAIIGAGPAGLNAAIAAAEVGAEVLLVDENAYLGGSLAYARLDASAVKAEALRKNLINKVQSFSNIRVMTDAVCNGWYADNWLAVIQGQRLHKVRATEVIMCVGSMEQQALFHNNDLPGIMMASAAQRLMRLYAVKPGQSAVVLAGNNDAYGCALDLLDAGVEVKLVVDLRTELADDPRVAEVARRGITITCNSAVYQANRASGKRHLGSVEVRTIVGVGRCAQQGVNVDCDLLCMSVGFAPAYQLVCQAGGQLSYDDESAMFTLRGLPKHCYIAGSVSGRWDIEAVGSEARRVAQQALSSLGYAAEPVDQPVQAVADVSPNFPWPIFPHPLGKEFVDYDEDLQIADIVNAVRDGYEHIQLVKRYSTCGMGPSQGRHSALAAARLVAGATLRTVAETGVTTSRPPFAPEYLAHNAGRSFYPARYSNMHHRHIEAGANMLQAGDWYRPAYYGPAAKRSEAIDSEVNNVRQNVGLVDVSTLGGIDVRGADAAEFLNRFYTFAFAKQLVGRARYALLTNEAGVVIDDGVACRLHERHYYVTATTGGVDRVYQSMLKWNAQWRLDVDIANVTSAWCGVNIAGPKARNVLQEVCHDVDLSSEAFPYMGVREGCVANIPARLIRVGFVGELGYEIHVPQHFGEALWDALMAAGQALGIKPFGIEAQRILRLEKGHVIIGQDTDAMSNPMELSMQWAIARKKPFFVGGRTINELSNRPLERVLAGFVIDDKNAPIPLESHLVLDGTQMTGRVTSCSYSPTLRQPIGLAYVPPDKAQAGRCITIKSSGGVRVSGRIVDLPFYDVDNKRQEL